MLLLALECADQTGSVALGDKTALGDCRLLGWQLRDLRSSPADRLIELVEALLASCGQSYHDLDVIVASLGPGSFTGVRSGLALARGLALAARRPALGVNTLEAIAAACGADDERPLMVAQDARRGEVYAQMFNPDGQAAGPAEAMPPEACAAMMSCGPWRLAGTGTLLVVAASKPGRELELLGHVALDARAVLRAGCARLRAGIAPADGHNLHPVYLRAPDAKPARPFRSHLATTPDLSGA